MAGRCAVTMVMMASLVCLLREQTGVLSAPVEPESDGEHQNAKTLHELKTSMEMILETMTAFKDMMGDHEKRILTVDSRVLDLEIKYKKEKNDFLERLDNVETSLQAIRGDMVVLKRMDPKILALDNRQDKLESVLNTTKENLEAALNTNNETSEVLGMVNSIFLRVENLENKTVSGAQQQEDLIANSTCGTCEATSISAELMTEIISKVENGSQGQRNGEQEEPTTQKWRDDSRCGHGYTTADGSTAECDPDSVIPCCSPANWCGKTAYHCDCAGCVDYRNKVTDCAAYKAVGHTASGVYTLGPPLSGIMVYCDMDTDGGGWTVIQRRMDGSVPFNKNWQEYKQGFGNKNGEYWLGNENIHRLTAQKNYILRIDMMDWNEQDRYAKYSTFRVSGESDGYRLTISGYSGTAEDSMTVGLNLNGQKFSTVDRDNDNSRWGHCSQERGQGGWWFNNCSDSFLNGRYLGNCGTFCPASQGVVWTHWKGFYYSLKSVSMKIRPR